MKYKNNMKKSWGIIKSIINKNKSHLYQTKFKLSDGKIVSDKTTISKHFNEFFLNVGPNLAKTIPKMDTDPKFYMGESISKARRYLNRDSLLSLYYSFIYPYLIYCNHVWGAAAKTHTRTLCTLQKRVIRIISGVKPRTHSDHLFKELKLLKFQDINTYLIGKLMFKVYIDDLVIFETWFEKNNSFHDYNTRQKDQYHIPSFKTKLGQSSLRFSGVFNMEFHS